MSSKLPSVSIIIVNYNSSEYLVKCLDSIARLEKTHFVLDKIVVVDNASDQRNRYMLKERKEIHLIKNNKNEGFAKACNQGADETDSDYLLFLNPDTILFEETLDQSVECYEKQKNKRIGVLGVQILNENNEITKTCSRFPKNFYFFAKCMGINRIVHSWNQFMLEWDHRESQKVDEVIGAYFFVSRDIFQLLNGFDERFFVYYEEVDFCYRLKQKGYYSYYYADTAIVHSEGGASKNVKSLRLFYELRSRILYMQKHKGRRRTRITIYLIKLEYLSRWVYLKIQGNHHGTQELKSAYEMLGEWVRDWLDRK